MNVTGAILGKVLEYCQHHLGDAPVSEEDKKPQEDEWDTQFVKVDQGTLFELILAANYLDCKPLLDLTCKTVAGMIKGKSTEEIRKQFGIVNDFTPVLQLLSTLIRMFRRRKSKCVRKMSGARTADQFCVQGVCAVRDIQFFIAIFRAQLTSTRLGRHF